ncbi:MAG: hypothetical protein EOP50_01160 [Sphingobacteriales bacterium]|nr:MAG: hypothetical protein EOP50_01160 [Sphingobacteriales bacterium]
MEKMENRTQRGKRTRDQLGFTYLILLIGIALIGIGLVATSETWIKSDYRQKEIQNRWIGMQYKNALSSYYYSGTKNTFTYPATVSDLLDDGRFFPPKRHLRQNYPNSFQSSQNWKPIKNGNFIVGFSTIQKNSSQENFEYAIVFSPTAGQP